MLKEDAIFWKSIKKGAVFSVIFSTALHFLLSPILGFSITGYLLTLVSTLLAIVLINFREQLQNTQKTAQMLYLITSNINPEDTGQKRLDPIFEELKISELELAEGKAKIFIELYLKSQSPVNPQDILSQIPQVPMPTTQGFGGIDGSELDKGKSGGVA